MPDARADARPLSPDAAADTVRAIAVQGYAVAANIPPADASRFFDAGAERVRETKTLSVVRYSDGSWAVAHDFGAVVFVGVAAAERERVVALLCTYGGEKRVVTEETFRIDLRAGAAIEVKDDRVIAETLDEPLVELVSLVVGQSVGMEVFESEVESLVRDIRHVVARFAGTGRMSRAGRPMLRLVGRAMLTRSDVVQTLALLDTPLLVWNREDLATAYRSLRFVFEIDDRYRALDHKISMVQDNLTLVVNLTHQQRSMMLEIAVVVLILVEIVAALWPLFLQHSGHP